MNTRPQLNRWSIIAAVSYTHLDVYKRQASNHSAFIIRTYANAGDIFISLVFFASFAGKKHQRNDISRSAEGEKALSA